MRKFCLLFCLLLLCAWLFACAGASETPPPPGGATETPSPADGGEKPSTPAGDTETPQEPGDGKKTYTVTYDLGTHRGDARVTFGALTQEVTSGENFTPLTPACPGDTFLYWVVTGTDTVYTGGVREREEDLSLTAVWYSDTEQDSDWSGRY